MLFGRYSDPGLPKPHRAFIWLLFNPPKESPLEDAILFVVTTPALFEFVDASELVVGTVLFPLNRLNGLETYEDRPPFCMAVRKNM
jgi:hypothetical protein